MFRLWRNKVTFHFLKHIFIIFLSLLVVNCGGGTTGEGGIGGSGISAGRVTGFGSIIVNGVHFDTTNAIVTKDDGTPVTNFNDADINLLLSEGMIVNIEGKINADGITGTAEKIIYQDNLEGPVIGAPGTGNLSVLGQNVIVSSLTKFSGGLTSINDIADGQVVEVSGFNDVNGDIIATYIEKKENSYIVGSTIFEIKGTASVVDGTTFMLESLTVVTTDTTGLDNQFVEVYGTFNGVNTLTTNSVEVKTRGFSVSNSDEAELEGIATSACSAVPCDFTLEGVTVRIGSNTTFKAGLVTDINEGVFVEAEGKLQESILIADEIEFKDSIEIQADVQSVGTDTVILDFGATDLTVMIDPNITDIRECGINNTVAEIGGNVEMRARKAASSVIATRIKCGGTTGEIKLQAEIESFVLDSMTILGLVIDTSVIADDNKFKNENGVSIGRMDFYNQLSNGRLVEVIGKISQAGIWGETKLGDL